MFTIVIPSLKTQVHYSVESSSSGAYGRYIKINSQQGVKLIEDCDSDSHGHDEVFSNKSSLTKSALWRAAKKEFSFLKTLESTGLVPKTYKLTPVYQSETSTWVPGIIMEHIEGKTLSVARGKEFKIGKKKVVLSKKERKAFQGTPNEKILDPIIKSFKNKGVSHNDLHDQNIIINKGVVKVIDFGMAHKVKAA